MKRSPFVPLLALALLALAGAAAAQTQAPAAKAPALAGAWNGSAVVPGGQQIEIIVVLVQAETGYTGKISDATGMVPETELRQIVLKDNKLSFEFDLDEGGGPTLIKIELAVEGETMKGVWFDPEGNSGVIELALKK